MVQLTALVYIMVEWRIGDKHYLNQYGPLTQVPVIGLQWDKNTLTL